MLATRKNILKKVALATALCCLSSPAFSVWDHKKSPLKNIQDISKKVGIHPFAGQSDLGDKALELFKQGSIGFDDAIKAVINDKMGNPFIHVQSKTDSMPGPYGLTGASVESNTYNFSINDVPICGYEVAAHKLWNNASMVIGKIPNVEAYEPPPVEDWPDEASSLDQLNLYIDQMDDQGPFEKVMNTSKCYIVKDGEVVPVWTATVSRDGLAYKALVDNHEVYHFENMFFHVQGKARVYKKNSVDGVLKEYNIEVAENGRLENEYFVTNPRNTEAASEPDTYEYFYNPSDDKFAETSAFVHAALMFEFFRSLGYTWQGPKALEIKLHVVINQSKNNALYQPHNATSTGKPTISIGDGDGSILKDLPLDSDVVSHEFGHHVIYRKLTSISGESLVLHEGMADYFAFAHSEDSCLGESICPANSLACWERGQCLRSANNQIRYGDSTYNSLESHLKGQLISGFLWDMRKGTEIPENAVDTMAYRAVDFFVKDSGLRDLVLSLMLADKEYYDGQYSCQIYNYAAERGFGSLISDVDCKDSSNWVSLIGTGGTGTSSSSGTGSESSSTTTKKSSGGCGTITLAANQSASGLPMILFILLAPVLLLLTSLAPVKSRKSSR